MDEGQALSTLLYTALHSDADELHARMSCLFVLLCLDFFLAWVNVMYVSKVTAQCFLVGLDPHFFSPVCTSWSTLNSTKSNSHLDKNQQRH
jgi:hypothetical protein